MSWVTFDDAAPLHRKHVNAGAKACWLWACGLAYCDRQETKDGFIPELVAKTLYPGLGKKEAQILVREVLWEKVDGGYVVHDYLEWREKRFNGARSVRGVAGGSVSSEAKKQAALTREANRRVLAQQGTTDDHNTGAQQTTTKSTTSDTTTTSPTDRSGGGAVGSESREGVSGEPSGEDPGRETACPLDLLPRLEKAGTVTTLAEKLTEPIESIRHELQQFVAYWTIGKGAGQKRTGWPGKARQWVVEKHGKGEIKPPGFAQHAARTGKGAPDDGPVAPSPMAGMVVRHS